MLVIERTKDGIYEIELDTGMGDVVHSLAKLYGVTCESVVGMMLKFAESMAISRILNPIGKAE